MVRSILFTGDCPAAREVHEKKLEERRQQRAESAASASSNGCSPGGDTFSDDCSKGPKSRSKTSLRKTTGVGTYAASVNPIKKSINEYLARLAEAAHKQAPKGVVHASDTWVLALETRELLTVSSLCAKGFRADHIVVPNPNKAEVDAMRALCPELICIELTSHELLQALETTESKELLHLTTLGWPGFFGVVWLDYCGSFASGPGRYSVY
jgi:hypothetical protein